MEGHGVGATADDDWLAVKRNRARPHGLRPCNVHGRSGRSRSGGRAERSREKCCQRKLVGPTGTGRVQIDIDGDVAALWRIWADRSVLATGLGGIQRVLYFSGCLAIVPCISHS
jgi:hypothetical protein